MTSAPSCLSLLFLIAALPALPALRAQEQPDPEALWKKVEKGEPLIALDWRRDAKGNFEYAVAGKKDAQWTPWFGESLIDVVGSTGAAGLVGMLGNPSDLVGLADAERHLRRIDVALPTGDLAAFVRTPLPEAMRSTALFDRMLAIDLLRTRTDNETKLVLKQLGADASLPKELSERATGIARRAKLDPAAWPLPKAPDVVVVVRPSRMPSMRYVIDLGRFSGYASSVAILTRLKAPTVKDLLLGETESDASSEFAFEVARRIGNQRLDEIGFAMCMPQAAAGHGADEPAFTVCAVGAFDVDGVAAAAPTIPIVCERDGDAAKVSLAEDLLVGRLAAAQLQLASKDLATGPRPELAKQLLNSEAVLVVHVPSGSKLCAMAQEIGLQGIQRADLAVTLRDADVLIEVRLGARDADAAKAPAAAITAKLDELGWVGAAAKLALTLDASLLRIEPKDDTVNLTLPLPRAAIPSLQAAKLHVLQQLRRW